VVRQKLRKFLWFTNLNQSILTCTVNLALKMYQLVVHTLGSLTRSVDFSAVEKMIKVSLAAEISINNWSHFSCNGSQIKSVRLLAGTPTLSPLLNRVKYIRWARTVEDNLALVKPLSKDLHFHVSWRSFHSRR
jgi:hypothetical protein